MPRALVLLVCLFLSAPLVAEPLPLEYFVKTGDYLDVQMSPSGNRLAVRVQVDERVAMVVIDRATNQPVGGIRPRSDSEVIYDVAWVTDERLVFSFAEDRLGQEEPVPTGELYAVDYDGKNQELIAGYRASDAKTGTRFRSKESDRSSFFLVDVLESDEDDVLVIEFPWTEESSFWSDNRKKRPIVSRLDVGNGRKKTIEDLPFNYAYIPDSTRDGEIRFMTYRLESGYAESAYRPTADDEWQSLADVFEFTEGMTAVGTNTDGSAAFLYGRHGEAEFFTMFRLDFDTQVMEPLFTDLDADVVDWEQDPETGEIVAGVSMRGKPRYHYAPTASRFKTLHKQLAKAFSGQRIRFASATRDGSELMVEVSSDVNPGEYYIFNTETKQATFFWANMSWIDPNQLRPMVVDEVTTEDGFSIPVRLTLPAGEGPAPLIVHPHGGPHGVSDQWGFVRDVQFLANNGFAVLQVNFRGSDDLGDQFQRAGYRQWGGKMIDDIAAATRWAISQAEIDGERVCTYGASYGAYAAYMLAAREPDLIRCAVGYVGVYDLNLLFTEGDTRNIWGGQNILERYVGTDPQVLDQYSPVNLADQITAESLLIHGNADERAPIVHAKAMRKALEAAGKNVEYIEIDASGHGTYSMESRMVLYEGLLRFLSAHL